MNLKQNKSHKPMVLTHYNYTNLHPIFRQMEWLYTYVSNEYHKRNLLPEVLDDSFKDLSNILEQNVWFYSVPEFTTYDYKPLDLPTGEYDSKNMIICMSGGKDSIATALFYKNLGYNIYLYHMRGVNRSYPDEYKSVMKVAKALDCPVYFDLVSVSGIQQYIEHPMKNMLIANGALHYGIREGIGTNIAFGNFTSSFLEDNVFDVCAGDCVDMWKAYEKIIQRIIPGFTVHTPLPNSESSLEMLMDYPDLLKSSVSCIIPYRFRKSLREKNFQLYPNIKLFDNRCGSCWKCCMEYIYYTDHDVLPYDEDYYLKCITILSNTILKETGSLAKSIQDIWDHYFFYNIHSSKAYRRLQNGVIYKTGCKFAEQPTKG